MTATISAHLAAPTTIAGLRRIGQLFVAAFVVFLVAVPLVVLGALNTEIMAAQRKLGVSQLPIELYAAINRGHRVDSIPVAVLTLAGMVLFSIAAVGSPGHWSPVATFDG